MFIRFFKTNQLATLIALPLFAALLWLATWIKPQVVVAFSAMSFYTLFKSINQFPLIAALLSFALVMIQAFYLSRLINKYDLRESRERSNFLAALFAVLFLSVFPAFRTLLPQHVSGIFLLLMVDRIFDSYRKEPAFSNCFDAGFFVSIATLFYFPAVIFLPLIYIGFSVLRAFAWREWLITLLGFLIPWFFVFTWFFWFDQTGEMFSASGNTIFSPSYFDFGKPEHAVLIYIFFGLLLLPAMLHFIKTMTSGKVRTNKFFLIFTWFLLLAVLSGFVFPVGSYNHFSLAALPLAVIFSNWFISLKKSWVAESLFSILLAAFVYAEIMALLG